MQKKLFKQFRIKFDRARVHGMRSGNLVSCTEVGRDSFLNKIGLQNGGYDAMRTQRHAKMEIKNTTG